VTRGVTPAGDQHNVAAARQRIHHHPPQHYPHFTLIPLGAENRPLPLMHTHKHWAMLGVCDQEEG